jgi:hypothetical protein
MPDSNEDSNERVQKAVDEINRERETGEKVNVAEKALQYRVHKDRIHRRLNRIRPRGGRRAVNTKLSAIQKACLLEYVRILNEIGLSIRLNQLSCAANALLAHDHTEEGLPLSVGPQWSRRFLIRYPELYKAKQKSLELK